MRRLAISNNKAAGLGTFKDILSNLAIAPFELNETPISSSNQISNDDLAPSLALKTPSKNDLVAARFKNSKKKKAKDKSFSGRLNKRPRKNAFRPPTLLPVTIELIKPSKQRVRVPANEVESTPSKHIYQLSIS